MCLTTSFAMNATAPSATISLPHSFVLISLASGIIAKIVGRQYIRSQEKNFISLWLKKAEIGRAEHNHSSGDIKQGQRD